MATAKNHENVDWASYEKLSEDAPSNLSWASNGEEGSGKSDFALSAPGPIYVCAFDAYGMNRVRKSRKINKDIRIGRYIFQPQKGQSKNQLGDAAMLVWNKFVADYRVALHHVRTVLVDREDIAYEVLRYANFGAQNDAPKEYGPLNTEMNSLYQEAAAAGVNLGLLRTNRDKWVSKFDPGKGKMVPNNTGERIPDGWNGVAGLVDITLTHRWDPAERVYKTKIGKFPNAEARDQEYPDLDWPLMAMTAYPESMPDDWGL
jgi:hypothetical protein